MKLEEITSKYNITSEQVRELRTAMDITWGVIAGDYLACFENQSEVYDVFNNEGEMVAEATIDADRIKAYGEADLDWFYNMKPDVDMLKMGEEVWNAQY